MTDRRRKRAIDEVADTVMVMRSGIPMLAAVQSTNSLDVMSNPSMAVDHAAPSPNPHKEGQL